MDSAFIISSSEKSVPFMRQMLEEMAITRIQVATSSGEARRILVEEEYDLCIVNAPLSDEYGEQLAIYMMEKELSEVILLVKSELYEKVSRKVERLGIVVVGKPISKTMFWNALKITQTSFYRIERMRRENKKLAQQIEDIRIINRGKCVLMSYLSMSEKEAHKHIERHAMDMRITKREVAEGILKTYDS
ncbi:MAG: ANTAR domain-containing protein [Eubacteriales bacterium]